MIIKKKRIRSYQKYFGFLTEGQEFRLVARSSNMGDLAKKMGFLNDPDAGQTILPDQKFGPVSKFNAHGKVMKRKDLPMETAYRTVEWHWEQWNGPYDTVEMSDFVDVPYQRYPREFIGPPSEEIEILLMGDELIFSSRVLKNTKSEEKSNLHVANLFLEIFSETEVVSRELESFHSPKMKKLNWQILPPGEYPWERVSEKLNEIVRTLPKGNQHWAQHRVGTIRSYGPDFHAVGTGGFSGYVVYGFSDSNLYILETIRYGNATYIFEEDWQSLSQLTKAQVLNSGASVTRVIHHKSWTDEIKKILEEKTK